MKNFVIHNPDQEAFYEEAAYQPHWYNIGAYVDLSWVGKPVRKITVTFA